MIRISMVVALACLLAAPSRGPAQTKETPQAGAAYARAVAARDSTERTRGTVRKGGP